MFKIIKSLAIIIAVIAIAGGGTYALFTHSASVADNTFSTGTVHISLANPNGSLPFTVTNWAPGQTTELRLDVNNDGTLPIEVNGDVSGAWDGGLGDNYVGVQSLEYWNGAAWVTVSPNLAIPAGQTLAIKAIVKFDSAAGNDYQNKTYRALLTVTATSVE